MTGKRRCFDNERMVSAIMLAEMDNEEEAKENAKKMAHCPRLILSGVTGSTAVMVFVVPHSQRWWLEGPEDSPDLIGAQSVRVVYIEETISRVVRADHAEDKKMDAPPCGSNCAGCPMKERHGCPGCLAVYHD